VESKTITLQKQRIEVGDMEKMKILTKEYKVTLEETFQ
jgi:hypothetical protein